MDTLFYGINYPSLMQLVGESYACLSLFFELCFSHVNNKDICKAINWVILFCANIFH